MTLSEKSRVLFVCTHNSARSQLAEAILRQKYGKYYSVFSAGTEPTTLNNFIKSILAEMGNDWSKYKSKNVNEFIDQKIDLVVTVCDSAKETCPFFPGAKEYKHKSFEDPSKFTGTKEEILKEVRRVRDEIAEWIEQELDPIK